MPSTEPRTPAATRSKLSPFEDLAARIGRLGRLGSPREPDDHRQYHQHRDDRADPRTAAARRGAVAAARLSRSGPGDTILGDRDAEQPRREQREVVARRREIGAPVREPQRRPLFPEQSHPVRRKQTARAPPIGSGVLSPSSTMRSSSRRVSRHGSGTPARAPACPDRRAPRSRCRASRSTDRGAACPVRARRRRGSAA